MFNIFRRTIIIVVLSSFLFSFPLFAGWTSSGGESLKDKINPWFLANTQLVKYCILVDEQNFGQTTNQIRRRIEKTIKIWKYQLANLKVSDSATNLTINSNLLKLGTQSFVESSCVIQDDKIVSEGVDLVFQFGVLSGEQIVRLGDPTKYIGVTVRTDYDPINLRAKGFIYFSPESGPLKLNKVGLSQRPWSGRGGRNMLDALLHETGHIFGIQHTDDLPFMKESYLESTLRHDPDHWDPNPYEKEEGDVFLMVNFFRFDLPESFDDEMLCRGGRPTVERETGQQYQFLEPNGEELDSQKVEPVDDQYFGYKLGQGSHTYCLGIKKANGKFRFEVVEKFRSGKKMLIGSAENLARFDSREDDKDLISIWLPKEQIVFEKASPFDFEERIEFASMQLATLFKGTYRVLATGEKRPFFVNAQTFWRHRYGGELNGVYYQDLFEGF